MHVKQDKWSQNCQSILSQPAYVFAQFNIDMLSDPYGTYY